MFKEYRPYHRILAAFSPDNIELLALHRKCQYWVCSAGNANRIDVRSISTDENLVDDGKRLDPCDHWKLAENRRSTWVSFSTCLRVLFWIIKKLGSASTFAGMQKSTQSTAIYHRIEAKHEMVSRFVFRAFNIGVIAFALISAAFPVSYICFGYPTPDMWILPMEIQ